MVAAAQAAFGPVDILINNAIAIHHAAVVDLPVAVWDRIIAVNLRGAFLTARACLPAMLARRGGTIVNMVSLEAMPGLSAYIASKLGLQGFSQSLAAEVAHANIRVIAFAPGMVDTPGLRSVAGGLAPQLGLSQQQFLSMSLHPDYAGLMPVEHAGVATAYLVARLADDYHGETVDGMTVLERAGLLTATAAQPAASGPSAGPGVEAALNTDRAARLPQALALSQQLRAVLVATEAEFKKLPVFVRPMAQVGFKNKAGQRLPDWQRTVTHLCEMLQQSPASADRLSLQEEGQRLAGPLAQLARYYREAPAEAARFVKDPATIEAMTRDANSRVAVIEALAGVLRAW
jgi:hypothetical protein